MKRTTRTPAVAIATFAGLLALGLLLRGTIPQLVRYMRMRRM